MRGFILTALVDVPALCVTPGPSGSLWIFPFSRDAGMLLPRSCSWLRQNSPLSSLTKFVLHTSKDEGKRKGSPEEIQCLF